MPLPLSDAAGVRIIIDHLGPGMFIAVTEPDGTLLMVNRSAIALSELPEDEVVGKLLYETAGFAHSDAAASRGRDAVGRAGRGESQRFDVELMVAGDRLVTVDFTLEPVRDSHGAITCLVASCHDVSERVRAHAELRQKAAHDLRAQRLASIGTLAGGIAHDLNNVLAPIVMSIELLRDSVTAQEDRNLLDTIATSAHRGAEMVRQMLSFARGTQVQRTRVDPSALVADVERIVRDTFPKNIEVRTESGGEPWAILGDATQLHQVLVSLCVNARDAMTGGGVLVLRTCNVDVDGRPQVRFDVEDSGTGMESDVVNHIFDPFFTTKEVGRGTGLGLPTSLAIVKGHEGSLHVSSLKGEGSRFTMFIPAFFGVAPAEAKGTHPDLPRGRGETILVVDDEVSILRVTQQMLENHGYRVLTASDGAEGLALYRANTQCVAAIVTDMMMPVMDGPAMMDELLALAPDLPVIASSAFANPPSPAVKAKVRALLTKPYTAESLLVTLRDVLPG